MAETVDTNSFKNGMHIELDGKVWRIVEFQHVKPGKGGAFVRTKLKSLEAGADRRPHVPRRREVRARAHRDEERPVPLRRRLRRRTSWTRRRFEQFAIPHGDARGRAAVHAAERAPCRCSSSTGRRRASSCRRRSSSTVAETEPGVKGDTVSNVTKPATLETGARRPGAALRERGRPDQGRPAREALHLARLDAQPRRLLRPLAVGSASCRCSPTPRSACSGRSRSPGVMPTSDAAPARRDPRRRRLRLPRGLGRRLLRRGRPARRREPLGADPRAEGARQDAARRSRCAAASSSARGPSTPTSPAASSPPPPRTGSTSSGSTTR